MPANDEMNDWTRADMRELRHRLDGLVTEVHEINGRLLVLETQARNSQVRNTQLPGWIIAIIGLLISAMSLAGALYGSGVLP